MAANWPDAPRTWVAGDRTTRSILNKEVRDRLQYLKGGAGVVELNYTAITPPASLGIQITNETSKDTGNQAYINFECQDGSDSNSPAGRIDALFHDLSVGAEYSTMRFSTYANGSQVQALEIEGSNIKIGTATTDAGGGGKVLAIQDSTSTPSNPTSSVGIILYSDTGDAKIKTPLNTVTIAPDSPQTYTPTNVVTDRSYDANSTSTAELADVLGTLIADLQSLGLLQ